MYEACYGDGYRIVGLSVDSTLNNNRKGISGCSGACYRQVTAAYSLSSFQRQGAVLKIGCGERNSIFIRTKNTVHFPRNELLIVQQGINASGE